MVILIQSKEEICGTPCCSIAHGDLLFTKRCGGFNSFTITAHILSPSCFPCSDIRFTGHMSWFRFLYKHTDSHLTCTTHTQFTRTLAHMHTYHPQVSRILHQMVLRNTMDFHSADCSLTLTSRFSSTFLSYFITADSNERVKWKRED